MIVEVRSNQAEYRRVQLVGKVRDVFWKEQSSQDLDLLWQFSQSNLILSVFASFRTESAIILKMSPSVMNVSRGLLQILRLSSWIVNLRFLYLFIINICCLSLYLEISTLDLDSMI